MRDNTGSDDPDDLDRALVAAWLHGRGPQTRRAYSGDLSAFRRFCPKPLATVTLADLQSWSDDLAARGLAVGTRCRQLAALKSLLKFGQQLEFLPTNAGAALRLPKRRDDLTARILDEVSVRRLLAAATSERDTLILRVFYFAALRVSELCALRWSDVLPRGRAAVLSVYGKGEKTRYVVLPPTVWQSLAALRPATSIDGPVFRSRKGGHLSPQQVRKIVLAAAGRAGLAQHVSPHWLRHCNASHALDNGAPLSLVQQVLGHANISTTSRYLHGREDKGTGDYLAG